jgi:MerR family transcriptional regulator, thiopeptide resistance regulator
VRLYGVVVMAQLDDAPLTVGRAASLAGLTVRTLHHWDEEGLLVPSERSHAGYRLYSPADMERLRQILFYRELGFPLEEIATLLDDPRAKVSDHMRRQHQLLTERIRRLEDLRAAVELHMEANVMGIKLTNEEMLEVFGEDYTSKHGDYQAEAQERWGDSDAWKESARRTKSYTKKDWTLIKKGQKEATGKVIAALKAGLPADSEEAMDGAEACREQIDRWFYPLSHEMHCGLAEMYISDPRFTKTYEDIAPGLAQYMHDAIQANTARV